MNTSVRIVAKRANFWSGSGETPTILLAGHAEAPGWNPCYPRLQPLWVVNLQTILQGPHAAGQTHQPRVARLEDVVVPVENRIDHQ